MPVSTIAMPCSFAAAITSESRRRPAGLDHRPDAVLGRDVEAVAEREERVGGHHCARRLSPSSRAFIAAIRVESTRLIWPAPTPTVARPRANTMAFDFTYLHTFHANSRSRKFLGAWRRAS